MHLRNYAVMRHFSSILLHRKSWLGQFFLVYRAFLEHLIFPKVLSFSLLLFLLKIYLLLFYMCWYFA